MGLHGIVNHRHAFTHAIYLLNTSARKLSRTLSRLGLYIVVTEKAVMDQYNLPRLRYVPAPR